MFLKSVKFLLLIITCSVSVCHSIPIFSSQGLTTLLTRASTPPQTSNILDLRSSRIQKFENQEADSLNNTNIDGEEPDNEVVPSLLNKKINKILQKIQLITSLSNGFLQGANGENDGDMNYENTDDDDDNDSKPDTTIFTGGNTNTNNTTSNVSESLKERSNDNDESFRIVFDTDLKKRSQDKYDKLEDFDETVNEMKPKEVTKSKSRSESPGGQFLPLTLIASVMQTLGSIMGHAYRSLIYFSQQNRDNN